MTFYFISTNCKFFKRERERNFASAYAANTIFSQLPQFCSRPFCFCKGELRDTTRDRTQGSLTNRSFMKIFRNLNVLDLRIPFFCMSNIDMITSFCFDFSFLYCFMNYEFTTVEWSICLVVYTCYLNNFTEILIMLLFTSGRIL